MNQWEDLHGLIAYAGIVSVTAGCLLFCVEWVVDFIRRIVGVV